MGKYKGDGHTTYPTPQQCITISNAYSLMGTAWCTKCLPKEMVAQVVSKGESLCMEHFKKDSSQLALQQSAEEELRLEEEISEALTALENSVERITAARLHGRTSSNRMVHGKFVTALLDIFQAYTARKVLEAEHNFENGSAYANLHADLIWCLGKLRGLGYAAEHLEARYHLSSKEQN